ncbi:MAG: glycosyltransferase [Proteobacteria bacterium]|nr:glycosyltransferase [Pseudomonadota bacterium]
MSNETAVLLATHNDGNTLFRALDSLLDSKVKVDVYIVDDASSPPVQLPNKYNQTVSLVRLDQNKGLTKALNIGLGVILEKPYRFIARMDADDIANGDRFFEQLEFLSERPEIHGVGTWARFFDESDVGKTLFHFSPPCEPGDIKRFLHLNSPLLHPSWCFRASVFRELGGYNEEFSVAQDYEFLCRASRQGYSFANIPRYLMDYQVSSQGVSVRKRKVQLRARLSLQLKYFDFLNVYAWYGLVKTVILFSVPMGVIEAVKRRSKQYEKK